MAGVSDMDRHRSCGDLRRDGPRENPVCLVGNMRGNIIGNVFHQGPVVQE